MTWWWIPVLEASRSSRLSGVGYTSCPAHTTEYVRKYADTLDPGQFLYFWLLKTVSYPITYCYVVTSWIWMLFFVSPVFKPSGWAFCISALSCKKWRWQQISFPTFLGSCHFPKNLSLFERYRNDKHFLRKCPSLMDGPDAKRFLRWLFAVEYYQLLIAIFSLLCIFFCSTCRSGLTIFTLDERI